MITTQISAELLKLRTTRTTKGLLLARTSSPACSVPPPWGPPAERTPP